MNTYASDEERAEALKNWLKDNGASLAAGIILGLSVLFGWRAWETYQHGQQSHASAIYEQMQVSFAAGNAQRGDEAASNLIGDYPQTPYAILASLALAKEALAADRIETAQTHLQWILDQHPNSELAHLARLRKARLYLANNEIAKADALLTGVNEQQFVGSYAVLRGDVAVANGDVEAAHKAYQAALDDASLASAERQVVQIKLDNLGQSESLVATAPELPGGIPDPNAPPPVDQPATPSTAEPITIDLENLPVTDNLVTSDISEQLATPSTIQEVDSSASTQIPVTANITASEQPTTYPNLADALAAPSTGEPVTAEGLLNAARKSSAVVKQPTTANPLIDALSTPPTATPEVSERPLLHHKASPEHSAQSRTYTSRSSFLYTTELPETTDGADAEYQVIDIITNYPRPTPETAEETVTTAEQEQPTEEESTEEQLAEEQQIDEQQKAVLEQDMQAEPYKRQSTTLYTTIVLDESTSTPTTTYEVIDVMTNTVEQQESQ